jgi:PDZ domain-containing protein
VLIGVVTSSFVRVQLWEVAPGTTEAVAPRLEFGSDALAQVSRYPAESPVSFVTAYGNRLSILDALIGAMDDDVDVQTYDERFGDNTPAEQRRLGYQSMTTSKQIAEYVAFNRVGLDVSLTWGDIIVEQLVCEAEPTEFSACNQLQPGDTIRTFNGTDLQSLEQLVSLLDSYRPGDTVTMQIVPHRRTTVEQRTIELIASPDDPERTIVGFVPADTRTVDLPFEIGINTDSIGGPSAGLAFTLALLDELTPGDLFGGKRVAATGTINGDESVGAIGALRQKSVAVKRAGVEIFFVPASQSEDELNEARTVAGSAMRIVPVSTLQEVLDELDKVGGSGLTNAAISL